MADTRVHWASRANEHHPRRDILAGKRILIVEDEPIVAVDYHFQLLDAGAEPVGYKATSQSAIDCLMTHAVDAAIVDLQLRDGTSERVMAWLREHGVPFVVISANVAELTDLAGAAAVLAKPVPPEQLAAALASCFAGPARH